MMLRNIKKEIRLLTLRILHYDMVMSIKLTKAEKVAQWMQKVNAHHAAKREQSKRIEAAERRGERGIGFER